MIFHLNDIKRAKYTAMTDDEAVNAFDDFAKSHGNFIKEFVQYRRDFISSDREAAAFMFAMEKYLN